MSARRVVLRALALATGAVVLLAGAAAGERAPFLLWNASGSVPLGLYLRLDRPAALGDLVAACLPEDLALFARARGYALSGSLCPGGAAPVLKRLAARVGARIELREAAVAVDGARWPSGEVRTEDSAGRPISATVAYPYVVPGGKVLLLGDHPRSFDGRYFGPLPESRILAAYRPLLTWEEETLTLALSREGERGPESPGSRLSAGWRRPLPLAGEGRGEGLPSDLAPRVEPSP